MIKTKIILFFAKIAIPVIAVTTTDLTLNEVIIWSIAIGLFGACRYIDGKLTKI